MAQDDRITVAVVGTAGRGEDAAKITSKLYDRIVERTENVIQKEWGLKWNNVHLISGGSAVADHAAVTLYLKYPEAQLTLEFPCQFWDGRFIESGNGYGASNPGRTLSYYHSNFSKVIGRSSILEISKAIEQGAHTATSKGFFDRNDRVSKSSRMIAFTFGEGSIPKDGGTKYTWDRCHASVKLHVPLSELQ